MNDKSILSQSSNSIFCVDELTFIIESLEALFIHDSDSDVIMSKTSISLNKKCINCKTSHTFVFINHHRSFIKERHTLVSFTRRKVIVSMLRASCLIDASFDDTHVRFDSKSTLFETFTSFDMKLQTLQRLVHDIEIETKLRSDICDELRKVMISRERFGPRAQRQNEEVVDRTTKTLKQSNLRQRELKRSFIKRIDDIRIRMLHLAVVTSKLVTFCRVWK